jgi:hypothetical protein
VTQEYYRLQPTTIHNQSGIKIDQMAVITEKIEALLAKANPCSGAAPSIKTTTAKHSTERHAKIEIEHWLRQRSRAEWHPRRTQIREENSSLEQGNSVACSWRFKLTGTERVDEDRQKNTAGIGEL